MTTRLKVAVGSDHGGYVLKQELIGHLRRQGHEVVDVGTHDGTTRCDYPDIAYAACAKVLAGECARAVLLCGTGIGISIAANKLRGIRCALCHDHFTALMCRQHNDANALAIGGRTTGPEVAKEIADTFLATPFLGEHHVPRLDKIALIEHQQHL